MIPRTSVTHPLQVPFLPADVLRLPGRIGLTFAPGKHQLGMTGRWERDLETDLRRLREVFEARLLVSLVEDHELVSLRIPSLVERSLALGMEVLRFPIADGSVPASRAAYVGLIREILLRAAAGTNVVIHCKGGLGRAGLVAAGCLVGVGLAADAAIRGVRETRDPKAIETPGQERFLAAVAPDLVAMGRGEAALVGVFGG
jgi:protein-tyrosine phosphatase